MESCSNNCQSGVCHSLEALHQDGEDQQDKQSCRRCASKNPYIFIDRALIECKDCFISSCLKKIRSTIGKHKLLRNNDSILLAYSGGASSTALLDLMKMSVEMATKREQKFKISVLHVDTQSSLEKEINPQERQEKLISLLKKLHKSYPKWPIYFSCLEMSASPADGVSQHYLTFSDSLEQKSYDELLNHTRALNLFKLNSRGMDITDRIRYYEDSLFKTIDRVAHSINDSLKTTDEQFKFVFVGNDTTRLANQLLVNIILGHADSIYSTVNICDRRPSVPIVRPLKEFSKKEIAFYLMARKRNIEFEHKINITTLSDKKACIQKLTEAFLCKLDVDFPSTYRTLLRTGSKMQE